MSPALKTTIIFLDFILFLVLLKVLPFDPAPAKGLALLVFIGVLWLTEALHLTVTALLVPILASIMGLIPTGAALASFANSTIFLYFGGFAIAAALHLQEIDKMIALKMIKLAKGNFILSAFYLFFVTAFLSMWVNNTSTSAMMLPLAMGMLSGIPLEENKKVFVFVLLGIAFSASIGGLGTAVGSIPNAIVVSQLNLTFAEMFSYGFPLMVVMMVFMLLSLYIVLRPNLKIHFSEIEEGVPMTRERAVTLVIFVLVACMWIFSGTINPILSSLMGLEGNIQSFDSVIAVIAAVLIVASRVINWKQVQDNTNWGVLFLFGGGITLSAVLSSTGASKIISDGVVSLIEGSHYYVLGIAIAFFVIFFTEIVSNTAVATLLIPLFISIAESIGAPPLGLALIIAFGASCAFMLPVATPPNAIVYGTGHIRQIDMIKVGIILNIFASLLIGSAAYFFWL